MIVVSGASGRLGRRTVEELVQRVDAGRVVALTRRPDAIAGLGVTARFADFDEPESLTRAFDGAERLLIVSVGGDNRFPRSAARSMPPSPPLSGPLRRPLLD